MTKSRIIGGFYRLLCGVFLGISVIAPGVSGSVMAVMMGIYDTLITIISNPLKNFKKNFLYLCPMGLGAVMSVALFIQLLRWLFDTFPVPSFLLFTGLIAGSLPTVWKEANKGVVTKKHLFAALLALLFAVTIGLLAKCNVSVHMEESSLYFALCGGIAGMTGMIPGMSVSMMLILLGVYQPMLEATSRFDLFTMLPVAACFCIGMVLFSKLTKYIFETHKSFGFLMVSGFMTGSLLCIFPGLPEGHFEWSLSIVLVTVGLFVSFLFQQLGKKFKK